MAENLAGATEVPGEAIACADAGQFAALWNSQTPERRESIFASIETARSSASKCFVMNHAAAVEEANYLRGRLQEEYERGWRDALEAMISRLDEEGS